MKNLTSSTLYLTRLNYELEGYVELKLEALDDLITKYLEMEWMVEWILGFPEGGLAPLI